MQEPTTDCEFEKGSNTKPNIAKFGRAGEHQKGSTKDVGSVSDIIWHRWSRSLQTARDHDNCEWADFANLVGERASEGVKLRAALEKKGLWRKCRGRHSDAAFSARLALLAEECTTSKSITDS